MMQLLPYLILGSFIFISYLIVRSVRRQQAEKKAILQELGFSEIAAPDPRLVEKVIRLRQTGRANARVSSVYLRRHGHFALYLINVWSGGDSDSSRQWTTAIVSDELKLPSFALGPSIPLKGKFGALLNKAIAWALERRGFSQVPMHPDSAFAKRYSLYAKDPGAVGSEVPDMAWQRLAQFKERLMIEASDDLLLFWVMQIDGEPAGRRTLSLTRDGLRNQIDCAQKLFELFRESALIATR
jgi:hypothetical protein